MQLYKGKKNLPGSFVSPYNDALIDDTSNFSEEPTTTAQNDLIYQANMEQLNFQSSFYISSPSKENNRTVLSFCLSKSNSVISERECEIGEDIMTHKDEVKCNKEEESNTMCNYYHSSENKKKSLSKEKSKENKKKQIRKQSWKNLFGINAKKDNYHNNKTKKIIINLKTNTDIIKRKNVSFTKRENKYKKEHFNNIKNNSNKNKTVNSRNVNRIEANLSNKITIEKMKKIYHSIMKKADCSMIPKEDFAFKPIKVERNKFGSQKGKKFALKRKVHFTSIMKGKENDNGKIIKNGNKEIKNNTHHNSFMGGNSNKTERRKNKKITIPIKKEKNNICPLRKDNKSYLKIFLTTNRACSTPKRKARSNEMSYLKANS